MRFIVGNFHAFCLIVVVMVIIPVQTTRMEGLSNSLHVRPESVLGVRLVLDHAHCSVGISQHIAALDVVTVPHLPRGLMVSCLGIVHTVLVLVVRNVLQGRIIRRDVVYCY